MAEIKTDPLGPRRTHVDPNEPYEMIYWTKKLGVSTQQLLEAIARVGTGVEAVERHLLGEHGSYAEHRRIAAVTSTRGKAP